MKTRWDYWKMSETGPLCTVQDFDVRHIFPAVKKLVKKYDIKYDPENLIPTEEQVENAWKAGVELLCKVGVLCVTTERIIHFEEEDIYEAIKHMRETGVVGEGLDAATLFHRGVGDPRMPKIIGGPVSVPISDAMKDAAVESYVREPNVDIYDAGVVTAIDGIAAKGGSLWEMEVEKREIIRLREAGRRAGRPGIGIFASSYTDPISTIGACNKEWGYRPSDSCHCYIMPNLKTDYEELCRAHHYHSYGMNIQGTGTSFIGGYAGGPEGAAIMGIAEALAVTILYGTSFTSMWTPNLMYPPGLSQRRSLWASALAMCAWATYSKTPVYGAGPYQTYAGPCTEMYLYEIATCTIKAVFCGGHPLFGGGRMGSHEDYFGGALDIRFVRDICRATIKMDREAANNALQAILPKYEKFIEEKNPPIGKKYQECNDVTTFQPTQEYLDLYENVKKELEELGLDFS